MNKNFFKNSHISIGIIKRGFTLVETLVAITILMIAVAGPLTVANNALTAALAARNTMIATFLAQDAMESINNLKDNNVNSLGSVNFLKSLSSSCTSDAPCKTVDAWSSWTFLNSTTYTQCGTNNSLCKLYVDRSSGASSRGYSYNSSDSATPFTRYYYLSNVSSNDAILTVVVQWNDGSVPNAITLQQILSNYAR